MTCQKTRLINCKLKSHKTIILNFCLGYLNIRYNNVKELPSKIIAELFSFEDSKNNIKEFLSFYSSVYELSLKQQKLEDNFKQNLLFERISFIFVNNQSVSISQLLDSYSKILSMNVEIGNFHFDLISDHFYGFINQKSNKITKRVSEKMSMLDLKEKVHFESSQFEIEISQNELINQFITSGLNSLEKDDFASKCRANDHKYFFSFVDVFAKMSKFKNDNQKNIIRVIFEESVKISKEFYAIGVKGLLKLNENWPSSIREFFIKFFERNDLRECLLMIDLKSLTKSEFRDFMQILMPILINLYFNIRGQKNKQTVISKQRLILNFLSNLTTNEIKNAIGLFLEHIQANFLQKSANFVELFASLTFGGAAKMFGLVELSIQNFGLQVVSIIPQLMHFLTNVFDFLAVCKQSIGNPTNKEKRVLKVIKVSRRKIVELFIKIYSKYVELDFDCFTSQIMNSCLQRMEKVTTGKVNKIDNILKLVMVFSEFEKFKTYFLEYDHLLPVLLSYLKIKGVSIQLAQKIVDILLNLIEFYPGMDEQMRISTNSVLDSKANLIGLSKNIKNDWFLINFDTGKEESLIGLEIINRNVDSILESIVTYFENTAVLPKRNQAINQPFIRNILIIILRKTQCQNQGLIDRISTIFLEFLSPKQLQSLNPDKYSSNQNFNTEFQGKIESKIDHLLEVIDLIALTIRVKSNISDFFLKSIVPLLPHLSNTRILLGFRAIFESLLLNNSAEKIQPSINFLLKCLHTSRKIEQDLDYDILFEQLDDVSQTINNFDENNVRVICTFVFKLIGSHDLSVRIKSQEIFKTLMNTQLIIEPGRIVQRILLLESLFDLLPMVLKMVYHSEDCLKNYVEILIIFADFCEENASKMNNSSFRHAQILKDVKILQESAFFEGFLNPKLSLKSIALNELLNIHNLSNITCEKFLSPLIENILFFNLAKHIGDLKDNNFRVVSSKKSYLTHLINATSNVLKEFTKKLSFSKLVAYIYKKLNMLDLQKDFQQPILSILSAIFDNFALFDAKNDTVVEINREYAKNDYDLDKMFEEMNAFGNTNSLKSSRNNFKQMSSGKMKKVRDSIHTGIDFGVGTIKFLEQNEENPEKEEEMQSQRNKLKSLILTKLKKLMFVKTKDEENLELRFTLSECFLKILRLFPKKLFKVEYSKMIMELAQVLKRKDPKVREKTVKCISKIAKITGPYLLSICISELMFSLAVASYRHVRNFSIWSILNILYNHSEGLTTINSNNKEVLVFGPGTLDHLFGKLSEIICEEIFSDMYEEKINVERKKKSKEIRKHKAKDILKLFISQTTRVEAVF